MDFSKISDKKRSEKYKFQVEITKFSDKTLILILNILKHEENPISFSEINEQNTKNWKF